jgi:DNA-binding response OmpR family regulator
LLSNAFKFTPEGGRVDIRIENHNLKEQVSIVVEDHGIGMTEEQITHIFDRFYQGDQFRSLGTGLGLALTKELVDLHHGEINIESIPNKGTRFEIRLKSGFDHFTPDERVPLEAQYLKEEYYGKISDDSETIVHKGAEKEQSLLIVEDNPDLRRFLVDKFSKNYGIIEAEQVTDAIERAFEEVPDLIICDLMLHQGNGYDIIERLKSDRRTSHIPIIVLSAKSTTEEKIKGIRLGADDYITKPFNFNILAERVNTLLVNSQKQRDHFIHELPIEHKSTSPTKLNKKFVNEFVSVVEENLSRSNFGVNEICTIMGLSRVQLYRKVKAILGYSVNDYINSVRLKKAKHLLLNSQESIADIGHKVGYSSAAYFSTAFKSHFGHTPSELRERKVGDNPDTLSKV